MKRIRWDERDERERDEAAVTAAPISHAARLIALQRTAGNHAVARLIAREAAPKKAPEPAQGLAVVDGLGTIPLLAVGLPQQMRGGSREKPITSTEVTLMSKMGEFSQQLQLASQRGDAFEVELLIGEKLRLKLHKALVSSFQESDQNGEPVDSWSLNAESIEFVTDDR